MQRCPLFGHDNYYREQVSTTERVYPQSIRAQGCTMIADEFDERVVANMDVALDRACRLLPEKMANHSARKFVAEKIIECAKQHTHTLGGLTEAARRAVAELSANAKAS